MRGNPDDAAGNRGRAANGRGLLVDLHRRAVDSPRSARPSGPRRHFPARPRRRRCPSRSPAPLSVDLQLRIADSSSAALMTASLPPMTTSSRWEMRLMHVGGDGGRRRTGTARPYVFGSTSPCVITQPCWRARGTRSRSPGRGGMLASSAIPAAPVPADSGCPRGRTVDRRRWSARSPRSPPADRPRRQAATPWCRVRRPARAGAAGSAAGRCCRTTRRVRRARRPTGIGRPRPLATIRYCASVVSSR